MKEEITKSTKIMIWVFVIISLITIGLSVLSFLNNNELQTDMNNDTSVSVSQPF